MFNLKRKVLFGVSVSMVLAMAIGSFALGENQTPVSPQGVEAQSAVGATFGPFTVDGGTQGTNFDYTSPVLTIHSGNLTVSTNGETNERIVVDGAATITLNNVNIAATDGAALAITDDATFDVNILLADGSNNILKGKAGSGTSDPGSPGIQKNGKGDNIGTLTIGVPDGSAGTGKLEATGGLRASGIGSGYRANVSNIKITGGEVTATGKDGGAGIGSGSNNGGSASNITITGGKVTATGGNGNDYGAGIGGGYYASGSDITISGGVVTATAAGSSAGIGGGYGATGSYITISGGEVNATCPTGSGAGIGGGYNGSGSYITINGGKITATGGYNAAGIGGGFYASGSDITINGGEVTATGGSEGAGIGGVLSGSGSNITINGGVVKAYGGGSSTAVGAAGIGGGSRGSGSGNSLNGDAVVLATSGSASKDALEGFVDGQGGSLLTQGIAFTGLGTAFDYDGYVTDFSWDENGTMYGSVTLYKDLEMPANLTVTSGNTFTINQGVTLKVPTGKTLQNDGTITINNTGTINCQGTITTKTDFYLDDGSLYNTGYQTYKTSAGVQKYKNLPNPYQDPSNGKRLINWYYLNQASQEVAISESVNVLLNEHSFHENSIEQFTVTFSVPTGTAPQAQTIDDGSNATDPQLIWAYGTVEGWYKDQAFTPANKWNFGTDTVTGNITLYAKFQCTVTFDPNYSGGSEITSQTVVYDNTVPEPDEPTRDGYSFVEWCKDEECTTAWDFENDRVQGDMTLYAKWIVAEHKVIIPTNPDDHGTVTTDPENPKTGDEVIITVTPEEGYEIDGLPIVKTEDGKIIEVIPTGNPNEYKFIMPNSDVTIEVHFVRISEPEVKTGDSFAGIAALAIIGLSTTGAALLRKRK